jgi:dUTP pyrophosphatase
MWPDIINKNNDSKHENVLNFKFSIRQRWRSATLRLSYSLRKRAAHFDVVNKFIRMRHLLDDIIDAAKLDHIILVKLYVNAAHFFQSGELKFKLMLEMDVKLLSENARAPTRGSDFAAGYDLYADCRAVVPPRGKALVRTGISIKMPEGVYGRVAPRSGLAWRNHIDVGAGVIDPDYRGEVAVVLFNHSEKEFVVEPGDRIAQLILEKFEFAPIRIIFGEMNETKRGEGGFGSSGN